MDSRKRYLSASDSSKRQTLIIKLALYVLVPILVLAALLLPPFSLVNRIFHLDYDPITAKAGGTTRLTDAALVQVVPGGIKGSGRFKLSAYDGQALASLDEKAQPRQVISKLPNDVIARGDLYSLALTNRKPTTATVTLPIPGDLPAVETSDLYGWDGTAWKWLPVQISADGNTLTSLVAPVYTYYLVGQTQARTPRVVTIDSVAGTAGASVDVVIVTGACVMENGTLADMPSTPSGNAKTFLSVSNTANGVARADWTFNLLTNNANRAQHLANLVAAAQPFAGLELNYASLPADLKSAFSSFVSELAAALHANGKMLALRLDPASVSGDGNGFDWQALGAAADYVNVSAPADPAKLKAVSGFGVWLSQITNLVDRRKVNLVLSAYSTDSAGDNAVTLSYKQALGLLAQGITTTGTETGTALPGGELIIDIPMLASGQVQFDDNSQTYYFTYQGTDGTAHTVWLANTASMTRRLQYLSQHALGGVALEGTADTENDPSISAAVLSYQANVVPPKAWFAFVWKVTDSTGKVVIDHITTLQEPKLAWTAPLAPGKYTISGALSDNGGKTNLGAVAELVLNVPSPTPSPTPEPTPTATPEPTAAPTAEATKATGEAEPEPQPTAAPADSAPAPTGSGGFGYGIQADFMSDGDHNRLFGAVQDLGLSWVKQQIEWFRYNPAPGVYDWGSIDRLVDGASARGIRVMLSVVKAPQWARPAGDTDQGPPADPATYATFLREMAARYKGRVQAYEIWNEQNLYYEWGGRGGKLSAAKYIALLKAAYNAIKSVDPNAVVVSGALTPTGVTDYDVSVDDRLYLEQMYQAGLASYCDAVGIHPSGYNNPPDADWNTWSDPSAPSFKGHPSFFFKSMMESYRNIMVKYGDGWKKLWVTEFGWASVDGLGVGAAPGYDYANNNTEAEQAQWITRAYSMGRNWGWVGTMFLWNLNFAPVSGAADEKAAFGIVRQDWSARASYNAIKSMAK
ncbi:MAG: glycosyl hydrolase family 18 protein [Anaerolineae bacterium]